MEKNKKIGMLTRNDKMTTRNNRSVEKAHWKHQKCEVKHENFLFLGNRRHQNLED
jgi:hypothetical protein